MTDHPSHPDQLMAAALGVCWHPPTSDRFPCQTGECTCEHYIPEWGPHSRTCPQS